MSSDLLSFPRCRADQLGLPMPDECHAVSACLPLWQHNVGYEEGDPEIHARLRAAYPRFCFHPIVQQLSQRFLNQEGRQGLPFVSTAAARRALAYVQRAGVADAEIVPFEGWQVCGVAVPTDQFSTLKQYWQHAGENVSSRVAELILADTQAPCTETESRRTVRNRVAALHQVRSDRVFLFPSGMAAIAAAWRAVQACRSGPTCQFGFPYVDTLKIQQRFTPERNEFFPVGNAADLIRLETVCQTRPPVAVFCEVPTNPLLLTPDLRTLRQLADVHDFLLIVDDTLGACGNVSVAEFADLTVTSLTKYFSGYGNVLAGSLVVNPASPRASRLHDLVTTDFEETLSDTDAAVLCRNSDDLRERMVVINHNAASLADFLRQHPAVASVFYPQTDDPNFAAVRTPDGGCGGLLSIVLHDPERTTPVVFDALEICKGPNLGTNFSLCCPYTILAHYEELDEVEACGVSRWLLRLSVGMEPISELRNRFDRALQSV